MLDSNTGVDGDGSADLGGRAVLADTLDFFGAAVEFLVLTSLEREQDQAGSVGLEALDVQGQCLL